MTTTNAADFRQNLEHYLEEVQEHSVLIESHVGKTVVLVSTDFYDRAIEALEDQLDLEAARKAKTDTDVPFNTVLEQLGLDPNNL